MNENRWIVECADLFVKTKDNYADILPTHGIEASKHQIQKFFDCVAATMSRQLRQIVFKSLKHFMNKILEYKVKRNMHFKYSSTELIDYLSTSSKILIKLLLIKKKCLVHFFFVKFEYFVFYFTKNDFKHLILYFIF